MRSCLWWVLLVPSLASAGEHRELCDKVDAATIVVELHFDQVADWPADHREKSWPPPARELLKTAKTGTVTHVFKGDVAMGTSWQESWDVHFSISGMGDWKTFMALDEFQQIWFLDSRGGTTGWAEESAGCGSSDQDSWCDGYEFFKTRLRSCLAIIPDAPLPQEEESQSSDQDELSEPESVLPGSPSDIEADLSPAGR